MLAGGYWTVPILTNTGPIFRMRVNVVYRIDSVNIDSIVDPQSHYFIKKKTFLIVARPLCSFLSGVLNNSTYFLCFVLSANIITRGIFSQLFTVCYCVNNVFQEFACSKSNERYLNIRQHTKPIA